MGTTPCDCTALDPRKCWHDRYPNLRGLPGTVYCPCICHPRPKPLGPPKPPEVPR